MEIFCISEFKHEFENLITKKAYRTLEKDIIEYFFNKNITELMSGTCLNQSRTCPYIKKRLNGSGGFRLYYLLFIKDEKLYLMFVHPKTGPFGAENITDEAKAKLYKKVLTSIEQNDLYEMISDNEKIVFYKS